MTDYDNNDCDFSVFLISFSFKWPFGETVCTFYGSAGFLFGINGIIVISATAAMRHRKIFSLQRGKCVYKRPVTGFTKAFDNMNLPSISNIERINPRLTKGGGYHTRLEIFSLPPQNQKESDQSLLGNLNLNYVLCGHFDDKSLGVPPSGGVG